MNRFYSISSLFFLSIAIVFSSCTEELVIPTTYDDTNFTANAADQTESVTNLKAMSTAMKAGDGVNQGTISQTDLTTAFSAGALPVNTLATTYYKDLINAHIPEIVSAAADQDVFVIGGISNGNGGTLSDHLFDENGIEIEQLIEKGLYGSALYRYAANVYLTGTATSADIDKALALFGAPTGFPNDGGTTDKWAANYISDRDAAGGFYTNIKNGFLKAQAASAGGFETELGEAVISIEENWEAGLFAQVIHYIYGTIDGVNNATTEEDKADALHEWSEAVGFAHGFYNVESKKITDPQIEALLVKLNAPKDGTPDPAAFFGVNSATELSDLQSAIEDIATIYGFTDPASFK